MSRTTAVDVRGAFLRVVRSASDAGINTEQWRLEEGSVTYGRAWKLYRLEEGQSAHYGIDGMGPYGYLGSNLREAYLSLNAMAQAFDVTASTRITV